MIPFSEASIFRAKPYVILAQQLKHAQKAWYGALGASIAGCQVMSERSHRVCHVDFT